MERQLDEYIQAATPAIPLGRTGTTNEIAKAVAFLASDESSYIYCSELFVDGGQGQISETVRQGRLNARHPETGARREVRLVPWWCAPHSLRS